MEKVGCDVTILTRIQFLSYDRINNCFVLDNVGFRTDFIDDELSFYSYKFNKSKILVHRLFMFEFC